MFNPGHETGVTSLETNPEKPKIKIHNQINIERWNWKKNQSKKQCKTKQIAIKRIMTKFNIKVNKIKCLEKKLKKQTN
jgi:hypothetical protein